MDKAIADVGALIPADPDSTTYGRELAMLMADQGYDEFQDELTYVLCAVFPDMEDDRERVEWILKSVIERLFKRHEYEIVRGPLDECWQQAPGSPRDGPFTPPD